MCLSAQISDVILDKEDRPLSKTLFSLLSLGNKEYVKKKGCDNGMLLMGFSAGRA